MKELLAIMLISLTVSCKEQQKEVPQLPGASAVATGASGRITSITIDTSNSTQHWTDSLDHRIDSLEAVYDVLNEQFLDLDEAPVSTKNIDSIQHNISKSMRVAALIHSAKRKRESTSYTISNNQIYFHKPIK